MTPTEPVQRFIPYRKADLVQMCCDDDYFSTADAELFRKISNQLSSIYHFQFHKNLETLKDCYAPMNPDADTKTVFQQSHEEQLTLAGNLTQELRQLLDAANFEAITQEDLDKALSEESLFQIRLHVDFDDFEEVLFFRRGASLREETLVRWFGLLKKPISFLNYDRVVVYIKFKNQAYFDRIEKKNLYFTPGSTLIKLFQNIPRSDLEMLFPNS